MSIATPFTWRLHSRHFFNLKTDGVSFIESKNMA